MGKHWKQWEILFSWTPKSLKMVIAAMKLKDAPWNKSYDKQRQHNKKQRHTLLTKVHIVKALVFPGVIYRCVLDHKENWALKTWFFWIVVLEKTLESPFKSRDQPVHPKGNQSWIFIQRTDTIADTPILRPPDVKNWVIGKYPDAGKDWRQENWMTEDMMVGWYHRLDGHKFD